MTIWLDGVPRPDHGVGMVQRACRCGASWVGRADDGCGWCADAAVRALEASRRELLWPAWAAEQGARYDELSERDRAVWDATRSIRRGEATLQAWRDRLADAIRAGIVTVTEARVAVDRAQDRRAG